MTSRSLTLALSLIFALPLETRCLIQWLTLSLSLDPFPGTPFNALILRLRATK